MWIKGYISQVGTRGQYQGTVRFECHDKKLRNFIKPMTVRSWKCRQHPYFYLFINCICLFSQNLDIIDVQVEYYDYHKFIKNVINLDDKSIPWDNNSIRSTL